MVDQDFGESFDRVAPVQVADRQTDTLWHYTDAAGLLGILGTGKIFATHFAHLNDPNEMVHGEQIALRFFKRLCEEPRDEFSAELFTSTLDYWDRRPLSSAELFVASFCQDEGDRLSQWRAYGGPGDSYAIGFRHLPTNTSSTLIRVSYSKADDDFELAIETSKRIVEHARDLLATADQESARLVREAAELHLFKATAILAIRQKHRGFHEEQEWRLLDVGQKKDIQFRATTRGVVPYLLMRVAEEQSKPELEAVYVGPANSASSASAVVSFLRSRGYKNAEALVRRSGTLFRR